MPRFHATCLKLVPHCHRVHCPIVMSSRHNVMSSCHVVTNSRHIVTSSRYIVTSSCHLGKSSCHKLNLSHYNMLDILLTVISSQITETEKIDFNAAVRHTYHTCRFANQTIYYLKKNLNDGWVEPDIFFEFSASLPSSRRPPNNLSV